MIANYIIIAWRSLLKNKLFSFINIFSLALSMSLCMMVMINMLDTFRYDTFHPKGDRVFRILSEIKSNNGGEWTLASTPLPLKEVLEENGSLFESTVSLYPAIHQEASDGVKGITVNGAFTQPSFFKVFGFQLLAGDAETALAKPNSIVLSEETAKKFFTVENPVGKIIAFDKLGVFEITGVLKKPKVKSHINFDVLVSSSTIPSLEKDRKLPARLSTWDSFEHAYTYVLLSENIKKSNLEQRLDVISRDINKDATSGLFTLRPQSLLSITPGWDDIYNDIGRGPTWGKALAEVGIGLIILLAACFNYTNLSIARALTRMKEVGIRKLAGALRSQIFFQYIVEAIVVSMFALCAAQIIFAFIIEFRIFNDGYDFVAELQPNPFVLFCFICFALFAGLLAGVLPAWILSSFRAVKMLRNAAVEKIMGGLTLRKVLLVFQFSLSLVILIFLTVFHRQFSYMADAGPGYRMDNIISIPLAGKSHQVLLTEFLRIPGIERAATSSGDFGRYATGAVALSRTPDNHQPLKVNYFFIDESVIPLSGLSLVAGKNYTDDGPVLEHQLILNKKAIEVLGFTDALSAIGETVWLEDSLNVTIIGVVADFYNEGVGNAIRPLALRNKAGAYNTLNLLITASAQTNIVHKLEKAWKHVYPDRPFSYVWVKKRYEERHAQMGEISMLGFLAFMTITIASLGLLGLVVYTVETRRKEISIRKVIGASTNQLMLLLSRGFANLLMIAGAIALPIGYISGELFLMNFANRISVGADTLVVCFAFLLGIGLFMITSQTLKASMENPVNNLRSE